MTIGNMASAEEGTYPLGAPNFQVLLGCRGGIGSRDSSGGSQDHRACQPTRGKGLTEHGRQVYAS